MRILSLEHKQDLYRELGRVGADEAAWPIFAAKARVLAIQLSDLSTATANILKQTALACGADCAVNVKVASGRVRRSDAILFATPRQLDRLCAAIGHQPECVARLVPGLGAMGSSGGAALSVRFGRKVVDLSRRTHVMGILNVTPDSFSDGGRFYEPDAAVEQGEKMAAEGADFIDIGAESTRPGSLPVEPREQLRRLLPVVRRLSKRVRVPISVDTASAVVAKPALDAGAQMVNDVTGFGDPKLARLVARRRVPCVLMHMKGRPRTMQHDPQYRDLMAEVTERLEAALMTGERAGVERGQMIVDPGIGFGKTREHNYELLRRLGELRTLGQPILVGPSRKRFIGETPGAGKDQRLEGTIAACVLGAGNGANIVRVHDVEPVVRALRLADAVRGRG